MLAAARSPAGPALLVAAAAVSQEVGAAFAVGLFAALGAVGAVFARFLVAGVLLGVFVRPRMRGPTSTAWFSVAALALTLTAMNVCFYFALTRIPLGVAVTVEVLGPLALSVVVSKRASAWLWAGLALAGVAMLSLTGVRFGHLDLVGLAFAAGAALGWAGYIIASSRAAASFPSLDALAIATMLGALATAPFAMLSVDPHAALRWEVVGLGVTVGVMSSVIPYSLELISLRHLPPETFAVVTCLSPVVAALAGWLVLGQHLALTGYVAIVLVTLASIGAVRATSGRRSPPSSLPWAQAAP
ncbi:EamA family transporter [Mycolicibacterium moriokaense]|uniref:Membrane protein n=1 Tax=Mycolicibacterium moriokaense TaxID=39691 RepID=A0AAD1HCM4_9MYCO|nr:EamA family transporter [Mycolicibacterium moriokaense]ORB26430.1 EamA family transporter [Mycolicibacterium moriokaense]BBX02907.1 membrane protein [Mycolicibacterium moriokaense]